MSATCNVILDTRRIKKKTSAYPIKLRIVFDRKPQDYQTILDLTSEDWQKLSAPRLSEKLLTVRSKIKEIGEAAEEAIKKLDPFSFPDFEKEYIANNPLFKQRRRKQQVFLSAQDEFDYTEYEKRLPILKERDLQAGTVAFTYLSYIKKLIQEGRVGTAVNYHCSYHSINKFRGNVRFTEITPSFLRQYELWMLKQENSKTTVGIYLRALRAIFNEAIHDRLVKAEKYPFGRRRYIIPAGKNTKKALTLDHIQKLYYYQPANIYESKAKDYWMLFYLGNGINPKDVALLKYRNIHGQFISFERAKTERTSRKDPPKISIHITEDIAAIIERLGNKDRNPNNYIFSILQTDMSPLKQHDAIQNFVKFVNKWMADICSKVNFDKAVKTIVARHSFATILKNSGASTEFIKEALGHAELSTTENYLGSFPDDIIIANAAKLTAFKKESVSNTA
jgi:integrase/recombinase XerD